MRYRSSLALAILVTAACSAGVDNPTAVETPDTSPSFAREGVKPPPPLGTEVIDITLSSPSSETEIVDALSGPSAALPPEFEPFWAHVKGRYFANTQGTNGWIAFESDDCVTASPGAKLQYNEKTGKTQGHGTLTLLEGACGGIVVLDLSKIQIDVGSGGFGGCELVGVLYECRSFTFSYNGIPGGYLQTSPSD